MRKLAFVLVSMDTETMTKKKNQARFAMISRRAVMDDSLSSTDFKVLAIIGLYLNADHECWPMQETIANVPEKPMSKSTVSRSIKRLKDGGYIVARKKWPNRPGTHLCYQVLLDHDISETVKNDTSEGVKSDASGIAPIECNSGVAPKDATPIRTNPVEQSSLQEDLVIAFNAYQAVAEKVGWPIVKKFTETRKKKLTKRLKEDGGLAAWGEVLRKAGNSSHCTGQNDRGWRAGFDFLVGPGFLKTLEGNYDDGPRTDSGSIRASHSRRGSRNRLAAFEGSDDELDGTEQDAKGWRSAEFRTGSRTIQGKFKRIESHEPDRDASADTPAL